MSHTEKEIAVTEDNDQEVNAATMRLYEAIEDMVAGRGLKKMRSAWHHTERVTSKHPNGEWAHGWDEVWATWEVYSSFGREDRSGTRISDIRTYVYGDFAYTTSVFQASPAWGSERIMCTNVLQRLDGQWKIIHHHADVSPGMAAALEKILEG